MGTIGASLPVVPGSGVGAEVDVSNMSGKKNVLVSGSFTGQVIVEVAAIAGGPFCALRTFAGPAQMTFELACASMRVVSQNTTGVPVVDVSAEEGVVEAVNLAVPAGNGSGVASDISALGELMSAFVSVYGTGALFVELSEDGANWVQAFPTFAPTGGCRTKKAPANFARVTRSGVSIGAAPVVQLAAIADAGGGIAIAEPRTCFVFRPGGVAIENVYTDWASLVTAVNSVQGCREILFDDSLGNCEIPAGAWDMAGVIWSGGGPGAAADVTFLAGSTVTNLARVRDGITLLSTAAAASILLTAGQRLLLERGVVVRGIATPIIDVAAAATATIELGDEASLLNTGASPVNVNAGGTCAVLMEQPLSDLGNDAFVGAGNASIFVRTSAAIVNNDQSTLGGTFTLENEYAENTFVLQPGGTARGNVFTDWDTLMGAAQSIPGPKTIIFDFAFGTPQITSSVGQPGGTWKVGGWTLKALQADSSREVQVLDGAAFDIFLANSDFVIPNALTLKDIRLSKQAGVAHLIDYNAPTAGTAANIWMDNALIESAAGAGRVINAASAGDALQLNMLNGSQLLTGGAPCAGGGQLQIMLRGTSRVNSSALSSSQSVSVFEAGDAEASSTGNPAPTSGNGLLSFVKDRWEPRDVVAAAQTASQLLASGKRLYRFDTSGGAIAQPLPSADWASKGLVVGFLKTTGDANALSVTPDGADTITGPTSTSTNGGILVLMSNGDGSWTTLYDR